MSEIDVTAFLLMIGYCTVPSHAARHAINTLWAWVRYFGALSDGDELRVSAEFSELDPHQKTILSDDFGMGMSLHLLSSALKLQAFCDGKYFIDRLAPQLPSAVSITATKAKNGARKSPDFIAVDDKGRWHVIECKGTQSGRDYCNRQLRRGLSQKRAVQFHGSLKGQSLVTGFDIADEGSRTGSRLVIVDPEPDEPPMDIGEDDVKLARGTVARGKIAKNIMLAGAPNLSRIMAAPIGDDPSLGPFSDIQRSRIERSDRLRAESVLDLARLSEFKGGYVGREATLDLPFQIETAKGTFRRVFVRSVIQRDVVASLDDSLRGDAQFSAVPLDDDLENRAFSSVKTETDDTGGELFDGKLYRSVVKFKE
ncbi:MAG: hypothetical protein AAF742_04190 [Pseudomonadota bacterium]